MATLAAMLKRKGLVVSGSDQDVYPPMSDFLAAEGIPTLAGYRADHITGDLDLVIVGNAISRGNPELEEMLDRKIRYCSLPEAIREHFLWGARSIVIAGTHGKTTTTGMLAKILERSGKQPTAIVGSIVRNFGSNFLAGSPDLLVVEACEYRDHVLKLSPEILVITNIELDHTDYFPDLAALQETFRKAVEKVPAHGAIITDPADPAIKPVLKHVPTRVVDYTAETVPELGLIGEFNRANARAAKAAARAAFPDIKDGAIDDALAHFRGSWRRFEYKGETPSGALVYDDYAHHPTAIRKTIEAARQKFPGKKIIVAFHPHLFSRTRDFMDDFADSLATADEIVLAPIYAAREAPIPGVSSDVLAKKIAALGTPAQAFPSLHDAYEYLATSYQLPATSLLITMGAGDIYKVAEQIAD